jgi:hypothetical protein
MFIGDYGRDIQYTVPSVEALDESIRKFGDSITSAGIAVNTSDIFNNLGF